MKTTTRMCAPGQVCPPLPLVLPPPPSSSDYFSPLERWRRAPPLSSTPPMQLTTDNLAKKYILSVRLPETIHSEMVTIAANKTGDRLKVVADAWHLEKDCHYEWMICFSPDVDLATTRAEFKDGLLTIDIRRC